MPEDQPRYTVNENVKAGGSMIEFEVYVENHTPSWKRYEDGTARFTATVHTKADWLALVLSESYDKSHRETMLTLDPDTARALYEFLHGRFGGVK